MRLSRQDVRLAARSLMRRPGFAIVAVVSLALAIALNTTMYSVLDAMISPHLELRDPQQLYTLRLWGDYKGRVDNATRAALLTSGLRSYQEVSFAQSNGMQASAVEYGTHYDQTRATTVAPNYFRMLGSRPKVGRVFTDDDFFDPAQPVMISDQLAAELSPSRPFPVGDKIVVDGVPRTVIGILGPEAALGGELWMLPPSNVPIASLPINIIRLRPGATTDQVVAELQVISARVAQLAGTSPAETRFQIAPVVSGQFHVENFDYALIGAVVAVLLVACANLANLQLARGLTRSRELAVRAALGASRGDMIVQLLLESALLAATGFVAGLIATYWGVHLLVSKMPVSISQYRLTTHISWHVLAFAAVVAVVCTLLVGLVPAIRVSRVDPNTLLKSGNGTGSFRSHRRQYAVMVATAIGLSLAVLSATAIVVRTTLRVREATTDDGLKSLAQASIHFHGPRDSVVSTADWTNGIVARLRAIPDAEAAAVYTSRGVAGQHITADEKAGTPHELDAPMFQYNVVSSAFLRVNGRQIVRGRDFLEGVPGEPEVIVDQQTAHVLWPDVDPIGMQVKLGDYKSDAPWARVVGVVANARDPLRGDRLLYRPGHTGRDLGDVFYLPSARDSTTLGSRGTWLTAVVRAKSDPQRMPISILRYVQRAGYINYVSAETMDQARGITRTRESHDFVASAFTIFAFLALGLSAFGVYGVVAHSVVERTRELGVRIALGATPRDILRAVLREGNPIVLAGLAVGLYLTKRTVPWLHVFSFEGDEYDVVLFASVAMALFALAFTAGLIPALRATRINPVESLRSE